MLLNPWTRLHDGMRKIGFAVGFIALGAAGDSVINHTAKLPALQAQAASVPSLKGQIKAKSQEIVEKNKEVKEAHCERDLAMNTTVIVLGGNPDPVHCPEPKK